MPEPLELYALADGSLGTWKEKMAETLSGTVLVTKNNDGSWPEWAKTQLIVWANQPGPKDANVCLDLLATQFNNPDRDNALST